MNTLYKSFDFYENFSYLNFKFYNIYYYIITQTTAYYEAL